MLQKGIRIIGWMGRGEHAREMSSTSYPDRWYSSCFRLMDAPSLKMNLQIIIVWLHLSRKCTKLVHGGQPLNGLHCTLRIVYNALAYMHNNGQCRRSRI